MGGESSESLRFLLVLTPNILIGTVIIDWPITAVEAMKSRVPWQHWIVLITTTLLLPPLKVRWLHWLPLVKYLPDPFYNFPVSSLWPVNAFFLILPAIVACAAILCRRRVSSYVLAVGGAIYILLVLVIIVFFHGGAMA
ncbi:MAG TPA: hypothetical protein VMT67_17760 [Terriglobales bacterium]|nr:hypothetical protein [Terriglobales bacterium]